MGKRGTLHLGFTFAKPENCIFDNYFFKIKNARIGKSNFFNFLKSINYRRPKERKRTFIYCDPPYLNTSGYNCEKWQISDFKLLVDRLLKMKVRFAISEFNTKEIIEVVEEHNFNIIEIGERKNMKNRRTELLITNYENDKENILF